MLEQWNLPSGAIILLPVIIVVFGVIIIFLGTRKLEKKVPPTRKQQARRAAFILWLIALLFSGYFAYADANAGYGGWGALLIIIAFAIGSPIYFIAVYVISALVEREKK